MNKFFTQKNSNNKSANFNKFVFAIVATLTLLIANPAFSQSGTRQVSPGNGAGGFDANGSALLTTTTAGSFPGGPADSKMFITVRDHTVENIFAGLMARTFANTPTAIINNAYLRITDPLGVVAFQGNIPNTGPGFIPTYSQAWNGPNISGSNPAGYAHFEGAGAGTPTVNPTMNGDYRIEVYTSATLGTTYDNLASTYPLFDFTIANGTTPLSGRFWCREWSFITTDLTQVPPVYTVGLANGFPNVLTSSFVGDFYAYTNDQLIGRINFGTGFRPLGFELSMNREGSISTGNFITDRRSRNGTLPGPTYGARPTGYRIFLTTPDSGAFPNGTVGSPSITSNIYGCPGAYYIPYYSDQAGDFAIVLDLNATPGYQAASEDVILQSFDQPAGNHIMAWNGLNGLGAVVPPAFTAKVTVVVFQGRINIPMVDAELNTNGFSFTSIFPALGNRKLYWDDTAIVALDAAPPLGNVATENYTTGGVSSTNMYIDGVFGPTHAYDGPNPTLATPAPLTAGQGSNSLANLYDDYGNSRIINTWTYAVDTASPEANMSLPGCDVDTDALSDSADLDDDNDGILDTDEDNGFVDPLGDADVDGVPNYIDPQAAGFVDTNFDGVDDRYDTDLDGTINQFDIDSDNDGCNDVLEAGYTDTDANGTLGAAPDTVNGSGQITGDGGYTGTNANVTTAGTSSTITSQPSPQSISEGTGVNFITAASGGSGVRNFQWQISTNNGATWTNISNGGANPTFSGATNSSLSLTNVPLSYNGYDFQVVITETNFVCSNVTTIPANLTVNAVPDFDGDSVNDIIDLDDDNDGIPDIVESSCPSPTKVEMGVVYGQDFGIGAPSADPDVLGHVFDATDPNDGFYAVTTSLDQTQFYTQTDATAHLDAGNPVITSGTTTGRYLMINIDSPAHNNLPIYRKDNLGVIPGQEYRFRIDVAGLCNACPDTPDFRLVI